MITNREEQINAIVEMRQPLVQKIEYVQHNLDNLSLMLDTLDKQRERLMKTSKLELTGRLLDIGLSLTVVQGRIADQLRELDKLKRRFSRDTLNIGVIGRARQGKSRLLQSLSGLTAMEIPDGRMEHCTGVRSTIYHNPGIPPYGEVKFYTEKDFLEEVIIPYYDEMQLDLGTPPYTLDEFIATPLPPLPEKLEHDTEAKAKYEYLKGYWDNIDKYRSLFRSPSPKPITMAEIREYVAQDTPDGRRIYSNYRAVREVKIVCTFPHESIGQGRLALIDMPGLGDTGIGDQERLIKTLGEDIDLVLFVRMPKLLGDALDNFDMHLHNIARSALTALPIDRWAFMVINRIKAQNGVSGNAELCAKFKQVVDSGVHITVKESIVANCADVDEVNKVVFDKILTYLIGNIKSLDEMYATSCQERLLSLQKDIQNELEKCQQALGKTHTSVQFSDFSLFRDLFEETLWKDLSSNLNTLLVEVQNIRDKPNLSLEKAVKVVEDECKNNIGNPSVDTIARAIPAAHGYGTVYEQYLNEIRTSITRRFSSLDIVLKATIREVKEKVAEVLIQHGRLGGVTEARGVAFLHSMVDILGSVPMQRDTLQQAFSILATFDLSYREFIQYRVRRNLEGLEPKLDMLPNPQMLSKEQQAKALYDIFEVQQKETLFALHQEMEGVLADPNAVAFAIVEEFIDQVLHAEKAKTDWDIFCFEMRGEIWPKEFGQFMEEARIQKQWQTTIDGIMQKNQRDQFRFLN